MTEHAWHGTTILAVRRGATVCVGGDGQAAMGDTLLKGNTRKVRRLAVGDGARRPGIAGFAGATADAFTLLERLEARLEQYPDQLTRAAVELAKDWRTDRYLRRLEAMMIVADSETTLTLSGVGDVLEPEHGIAAIGSGSQYARAAAQALYAETDLPAVAIVKKAMAIAASICVYTNDQLTLETLGDGPESPGPESPGADKAK